MTLGQVVVPCGGLGTRLSQAIGGLPKALAPMAGRPLLAHLLADLARAGASEVLLLAGVGAEALQASLADLTPPGLAVRISIESARLGTAGALRQAEGVLAERFTLVFGDVYTALDWPRFVAAAERKGGLATLVVHRSTHPEDSDLLALSDDLRVVAWSRRGEHGARGMALGNAAVAVMSRDILSYIPAARATDLFGDVLPQLVAARAPVHGYLTAEYVKDAGTPERLAAVEQDVVSGRARSRAELVLVDRDGTLVVERSAPLRDPREVELLPGAAAGIALLNRRGIRVHGVTNQAGIARGTLTEAELAGVHAELARQLAAQGAHLDGLSHCPHHPEVRSEGVAALRGPCRCRKPGTGMLHDAIAAHGRPAWRTALVGDASIDLQAAANAAIAGYAVDTGQGARDGRYPAEPSGRFPDLAAAASWLAGEPTSSTR